MQKLVSQRESESKLRDTYEQELTAQTRLAQIYKGQFREHFQLQTWPLLLQVTPHPSSK
jgi:hypothetical protein